MPRAAQALSSQLTPIAFTLAALVSGPTSAVTLFDGEQNRTYLSGFADLFINSQELDTRDQKISDDGQMSAAATRFRFTFEHDISEQLKVDLLSEYFVNLVNGDFERSSLFINRLGSIGFNAPQSWGEIRLGKQWSPFYSLVLSYIDGPILSDADAAGVYNLTDGGIRGVGRLDKGIGYLKSWGRFSFGIQAGMKQQARGASFTVENTDFEAGSAERDWNAALAVKYATGFGLDIGVGFNQSEIDVTNGVYYGLVGKKTSELAAIGLSYNYQNKLRIASSIIPYARYYHVTSYEGQGTRSELAEIVRNSYSADIWIRYRFSNDIIPYVYFSYIDMDDLCREADVDSENNVSCTQRDDSDRISAYVGAMYFLSNQLSMSVGYDYTDFETAIHRLKNNDRIGFKIRYWYDKNTSGW